MFPCHLKSSFSEFPVSGVWDCPPPHRLGGGGSRLNQPTQVRPLSLLQTRVEGPPCQISTPLWSLIGYWKRLVLALNSSSFPRAPNYPDQKTRGQGGQSEPEAVEVCLQEPSSAGAPFKGRCCPWTRCSSTTCPRLSQPLISIWTGHSHRGQHKVTPPGSRELLLEVTLQGPGEA